MWRLTTNLYGPLTSGNGALWLDGGGHRIFFHKSSKTKIEQPFCAANMKMQIHGKMFCSSILLKGASHDFTRVTAYACHSISIQISQIFRISLLFCENCHGNAATADGVHIFAPFKLPPTPPNEASSGAAASTTAPTPVTVILSAAAAWDMFWFSSAPPSHICFSILNSLRPALWPPCCQFPSCEEVAAVRCLHSLPASNCSRFGSCTFLFVVSWTSGWYQRLAADVWTFFFYTHLKHIRVNKCSRMSVSDLLFFFRPCQYLCWPMSPEDQSE